MEDEKPKHQLYDYDKLITESTGLVAVVGTYSSRVGFDT